MAISSGGPLLHHHPSRPTSRFGQMQHSSSTTPRALASVRATCRAVRGYRRATMTPHRLRYHILLAPLLAPAYIAGMNSKQCKTLAAIFKEPTSGTIEWAAIENLLAAVGCWIIEGSGSRIRFEKDGEIESFHRPHPAKEAKRYQVRAAREYLIRLGVTP